MVGYIIVGKLLSSGDTLIHNYIYIYIYIRVAQKNTFCEHSNSTSFILCVCVYISPFVRMCIYITLFSIFDQF